MKNDKASALTMLDE